MARILIVEDEPDIAMGLEEDLKIHGHEVEVAGDGEVALRANTTHFCITDGFGNMVSNTYSLNTMFGCKLAVAGAAASGRGASLSIASAISLPGPGASASHTCRTVIACADNSACKLSHPTKNGSFSGTCAAY